jgi:hypothetical protein
LNTQSGGSSVAFVYKNRLWRCSEEAWERVLIARERFQEPPLLRLCEDLGPVKDLGTIRGLSAMAELKKLRSRKVTPP